jgi:predicted transcriptional regulator
MKLTEAEWQIMNALWQNQPATTRQIVNRLPEDVNWAYTTVKTMLTRLAEKKVVKESKNGNVAFYEPVLSRQKARRSALKSLVNQAFDGALTPMMQFLLDNDHLSKKQLSELESLIKKKRARDS